MGAPVGMKDTSLAEALTAYRTSIPSHRVVWLAKRTVPQDQQKLMNEKLRAGGCFTSTSKQVTKAPSSKQPEGR